MSGVGLVAVAFCGGYTVRFGPKDPFAICSAPPDGATHIYFRLAFGPSPRAAVAIRHKEVDQHIVTNITQPSTKRVFVQAPPANDRPTAPNESDD